MNAATFNIGTQITVIFNNMVYCAKMKDFATNACKFDSVTIKGNSKPAKLAKYQSQLLGNGFTLVSENFNRNAGFEGQNADVVNYSLTYTKN